jgi:endoglucanase
MPVRLRARCRRSASTSLPISPTAPSAPIWCASRPARVEWALIPPLARPSRPGSAKPKGRDTSSGLDVHIIDFSGLRHARRRLPADRGRRRRQPAVLDFATTAYGQLRHDALGYFYKVRSGIEIQGEELAGQGYGRPAGHLGKAPNRGDTSVGCVDTRTARKVYGKAWSCGYKLNVAGGWYDAGDFGKYVVNGGIADSAAARDL